MFKKSAFLGTSALLTVVMAMPAAAQTTEYTDVIVTATKRPQTLQETPVAVTVTPAAVLEKAAIEDIGDLQSVVPTLRVSQLQNSGNTSFSLRGFGNGTNNVGTEPSVGVFIDGVYRSRAAAAINNLPNLERVEVLPGPQSTLFGKNASGGVVSIVTSAPSFERQGHLEVGFGNYNRFQGKAFITDGLNDTIAYSLGANFETADGYFDVDGAKDFNDTGRWGVRGQLLIEPSDSLSLRLIADANGIDEQCCGTAMAIEGPISAANRAAGLLPADSDPYAYVANANRDSNNEVLDGGLSLQVDYDLANHTLTSITALRANDWSYNADSDYSSVDVLGNIFQSVDTRTFTQELRLSSNTGTALEYMVGGFYFDEALSLDSGARWGASARAFVEGASPTFPGTLAGLEAFNGLDAGSFFAAGTGQNEFFEQDDTALSLFGTVDFDVSDRFTLSGGLNYTSVEKDVSLQTELDDTFSTIDLTVAPNSNVIAGTASVVYASGIGDPTSAAAGAFAASILPLLVGSPFEGAAFTQATIDALNANASTAAIMPGFQAGFEATVAGGVTAGLQGVQFLPPHLLFPNSVEDGQTSDDQVTWSVRGSYEVNDNINVFAGAATGYKASSWNLTRDTRPFASQQADIEGANLNQVNQQYNSGGRFADPEESLVLEIGLKARFDKGAINVTVFDQTIENFQSAIFEGSRFNLLNADEQSTRGIEFDTAYSPTENWDFTFGGALLDPTYDSFSNAAGGVDLTGEKPAGIPEVALATSVTYNHNFASGMFGYVRVDNDYQSEVAVVDNLPDSVTRTVNTFNASAGLDFENGIALQLWGRNIFNDEYPVSGFPTPLISTAEAAQGLTQSISIYPNQPATYGASLRYNF